MFSSVQTHTTVCLQVLHVYDLIDADGNIQGQPGYLNETVYAGDKLLYVDSVPTTGLSFYSVRSALDGPIGSHVTLTLERSNDAKLYEVRGSAEVPLRSSKSARH